MRRLGVRSSHSDNEQIIRLLNGFGARDFSGEDVFLDENGEPTDRFLQALKSDLAADASRLGRKGSSSGSSSSSSSSSIGSVEVLPSRRRKAFSLLLNSSF